MHNKTIVKLYKYLKSSIQKRGQPTIKIIRLKIILKRKVACIPTFANTKIITVI